MRGDQPLNSVAAWATSPAQDRPSQPSCPVSHPTTEPGLYRTRGIVEPVNGRGPSTGVFRPVARRGVCSVERVQLSAC
jgi:hypothetical protein